MEVKRNSSWKCLLAWPPGDAEVRHSASGVIGLSSSPKEALYAKPRRELARGAPAGAVRMGGDAGGAVTRVPNSSSAQEMDGAAAGGATRMASCRAHGILAAWDSSRRLVRPRVQGTCYRVQGTWYRAPGTGRLGSMADDW